MTVVCPACGFENSEQARFCGGCAAPLDVVAPTRETRKTVTIVFCDVTGSTSLGERLDPESLRRVLARYFEAMRLVIEQHGGTVEKFIGDAVMAVFGIPVVHEDDGLRAVRAATGMREALARLNEELEHDYGTRLEARIGVNTGEVVTGTEERLATGDAVNVASRLEQAASPGEILLGLETYRLVRDAVDAEEVASLRVKGKADVVSAYRLHSVSSEAPSRRLDVPFVGRERELRLLRDAWERAVSELSCVLFTLLGVAGVGKSRLVEEFLRDLDALVVRGRCLSYGEGITYWPAVEVVLQLRNAGHEPTGPVAVLLGEGGAPTSPEEIAWGVRRLLEGAAAEAPLVAVLDDLQWAEPAFLELLQHVATMSRGAPILLFCVARPDLLERRPSWGGGLLNATTVLLEPLSAEETEQLIAVLGGGLDAELAARIGAAAEGNPLFVEEMRAMVEESGGDVVVPPTVQALLAARLDQLEPAERGVLERGSVEGQVFHRGAVQALAPDEPEVAPRLAGLVRKELVRPEAATFAGEDAYRFRHILIRDAAYDAVPKANRAELHERFAAWLDERGELVEQDEIVGYHLEQAHRYRAELGPLDGTGLALACAAAGRLLPSGRAAQARGDVHAAASLLGRTLDLLPEDDASRLELMVELATVLLETEEFARAGSLLDRALAEGDERIRVRARVVQILLSTFTQSGSEFSGDLLELGALVQILERLDDREGLADAWGHVARLRFYAGHCRAAEEAYECATEHARVLGDRRRERDLLEWWITAKRFGSTSAAELLAFLEGVRVEYPHDLRLALTTEQMSAVPAAMQHRFDEARALIADPAHAKNFGISYVGAGYQEGASVELLAGDFSAAAGLARTGWDLYAELGVTGFRATMGSLLAQALEGAGEDEEAESILGDVGSLAQRDDIDAQVRLRSVRARLAAKKDELGEAEQWAREAVAIADDTDYLELGGDAHLVLGDVLRAASCAGAEAEWHAALDLYERKGNLVGASQVQERLG